MVKTRKPHYTQVVPSLRFPLAYLAWLSNGMSTDKAVAFYTACAATFYCREPSARERRKHRNAPSPGPNTAGAQ